MAKANGLCIPPGTLATDWTSPLSSNLSKSNPNQRGVCSLGLFACDCIPVLGIKTPFGSATRTSPSHPPPSSSHSPDGWAFTNNIDINQHQSLEDRLSAAQILLKKDPLCPVVVDDMSDTSAIKYGALPERLYVLQAGKVIYKVRGGVPLDTPAPASLNFYLPLPLQNRIYCAREILI